MIGPGIHARANQSAESMPGLDVTELIARHKCRAY
jgi:hypothetical protein